MGLMRRTYIGNSIWKMFRYTNGFGMGKIICRGLPSWRRHESFWEITKVTLKPPGHSLKVWGIQTWRGVKEEKERRITGILKKDWYEYPMDEETLQRLDSQTEKDAAFAAKKLFPDGDPREKMEKIEVIDISKDPPVFKHPGAKLKKKQINLKRLHKRLEAVDPGTFKLMQRGNLPLIGGEEAIRVKEEEDE